MTKEFNLDPDIADELKHYGVKGMKWGVRKDRGGRSGLRRAKDLSAGDSSGAKPKRQSRRQRRIEKYRANIEAHQARAAEVFTQAANNPDSLVKVRTEYGPYILTGQQFVDYVSSGGAFDVKTLDIVVPEKER